MTDTLTTGAIPEATWAEVADMDAATLGQLILAQGEKIGESMKDLERRLDASEQARARAEERSRAAERELAEFKAATEKRMDALHAMVSESWVRIAATFLHSIVDAFKARPKEALLMATAFLVAVLALRGVVVESQYFNIRQGTGGDDDSEPGTWAADDDDHDGGTMDEGDSVVGGQWYVR